MCFLQMRVILIFPTILNVNWSQMQIILLSRNYSGNDLHSGIKFQTMASYYT